MDIPENWFPIAGGYDGSYLVITDQLVEGGYLRWHSTGDDFEEDLFNGMIFEDWLEQLIIVQGAQYWDWNFRRPI